MTTLTLAQFERIDGLRNRARYDATARSHITGAPIRPIMNEAQHQSRLFTALIDTIGYNEASEIECLEEYADNLITDCLIGKINVVDEVAA